MRHKPVVNPFPPPPLTPSNTPPSPHWLYDLLDIHDKLMHSFHNRQIRSLEGFMVSEHRWSCSARFPSPPPRSLLFQPSPPRPYKLRPRLTG